MPLRQKSGLRLEELRGYLWPTDVYTRVKGEKPPKTMKLVSIPYQGRVVSGVLLDESHGRPVGSIAFYGEDHRFVEKAREGITLLSNRTLTAGES